MFGSKFDLESYEIPTRGTGNGPSFVLSHFSSLGVWTTMSESISSTSSLVAIPSGMEFRDDDEPPSLAKPTSRRHPAWADIADADWNDWRWQAQHAVRHAKQIVNLLPFTAEEIQALHALEAQYKLAIPPYYFSLIDRDNRDDPIRLQSVPSLARIARSRGC